MSEEDELVEAMESLTMIKKHNPEKDADRKDDDPDGSLSLKENMEVWTINSVTGNASVEAVGHKLIMTAYLSIFFHSHTKNLVGNQLAILLTFTGGKPAGDG